MKDKKLQQWAGHTWPSLNSFLHTVLQEDPTGKKPLVRPHLR